MGLVGLNVYAERRHVGAGVTEVCIHVVMSKPDGSIFHLACQPPEIDRMIDALTDGRDRAVKLLAGDARLAADLDQIRLCSVCNERQGKSIYGGKCLSCHEAQRAEREQ